MKTVREHVAAGRLDLLSAGLTNEEAAGDAEVLARNALGWDRATYISNARASVPTEFVHRYRGMLDRRVQREPVALITGQREFWGLEFTVTRDVLTPRPETELLVEETITLINKDNQPRPHVVDVGTGSGCVAIAVAKTSSAQITATDVSSRAIAVARQNAKRHGVDDSIQWVCAPLLQGVYEPPDIITANLPYIPTMEISKLPPEVRQFEPRMALDGGTNGLALITQLLREASLLLKNGGNLILEIGSGQAPALSVFLKTTQELEMVNTRNDLQGIARVITLRRHSS